MEAEPRSHAASVGREAGRPPRLERRSGRVSAIRRVDGCAWCVRVSTERECVAGAARPASRRADPTLGSSPAHLRLPGDAEALQIEISDRSRHRERLLLEAGLIGRENDRREVAARILRQRAVHLGEAPRLDVQLVLAVHALEDLRCANGRKMMDRGCEFNGGQARSREVRRGQGRPGEAT